MNIEKAHEFMLKVKLSEILKEVESLKILSDSSLELTIESSSPDYENLVKLSDYLKTTKIRFWSYESGCPTCGGGVSTVITIDEIPNLPELLLLDSPPK